MNRIILAGAIAALALLQGCAQVAGKSHALLRDTSFGPVVGTHASASKATYSWKGVPFAHPPVGDLRWKATVDPDHWTKARTAAAFAPACVQTGRLYSPGASNGYDETIGSRLGKTVGSEDCLYLNIWAPSAPSDTPRPVIVWIYGGSNITGYTADPVYNGSALAKSQNAVVVSIPYRLGIFGFLNVKQLKTGNAEDDSGNFALLDIVKGLEFVQRNIASFGGDPGRVTLMGSRPAPSTFTLCSPLRCSPPERHRFISVQLH